MVTLEIKGLKELQDKLDGKIDALIKGVDNEIGAFCLEVSAEQKRRVPVDMGLLRSSLHTAKVAPLNWTILSAGPGSSYSGWVEFGTGPYTQIPPGLEEEARLFYVNGKGHTRAQPFFFSPFLTKQKELIQNITNLLKK